MTILTDSFGNPLGTTSQLAQEAYVDALEAYLDARDGIVPALDRAIDADPEFALAYTLKARTAQVYGQMTEAKALSAQAVQRTSGLPEQVASHIGIFDDLIHSRVGQGYDRARAHLVEHPRDTVVAGTCLGVFSLIGFSGREGREAEHLSLVEQLAPAYGDDPWFQSQLAFAQMETGHLSEAAVSIEKGIKGRPRSANTSHIRSHLYYEMGETEAGRDYLQDWMKSYSADGLMHCHNSWHVALWSLSLGDVDHMWQVVREALDPDVSTSPALNILTDLASLYWRAEMAGETVPDDAWQRLSDYAITAFPNPALGFADVHAALAHAMAGHDEPLKKIAEGPKGPVADLVAPCAEAFRAIAKQDWARAEAELIPVMVAHERLGGSRAQRDIIDLTLLHTQIRQGRADEARRLLAIRRPRIDSDRILAGLAA